MSPGIRKKPTRVSGRAVFNLLLFVAVMLALWIGFSRHLQPLLAEAMILGGTVGVWALLSVGYNWIKALKGKEIQSLTAGLFSSPRATEPLGFALFAAVTLQLFTASVYVEHRGDHPEFTVEVTSGSRVFIEPLTVSKQSASAGRPFLGELGSPELTFHIKDEPLRRPIKRTLKPWSSLRLKVPDDFPERQVTALRVLPGIEMMNCYLPDAGEPRRQTTYELHLTIGDETFVEDDLRKRPLYIGGNLKILELAHEQTGEQALEGELRDYLIGKGVPEEHRATWIQHWMGKPAMMKALELTDRQEIKLEFFRRTPEGLEAEPLDSRTLTVGPDWIGRTTSLFMEVAC